MCSVILIFVEVVLLNNDPLFFPYSLLVVCDYSPFRFKTYSLKFALPQDFGKNS